MNFQDLITARQSIRHFKEEVPGEDLLVKVLDAARLAPSAVNFQPWQFIVVRQKEALAALHTCYHREWFQTAPACIVVLGDHHAAWHRKADGKDHTDVDVAIAIDHLTLQAADLGLGTCWVCNFEADMVRSLYDLPKHIEPIALIPIGWPDDETELLPKEKNRKAFTEIVKWI